MRLREATPEDLARCSVREGGSRDPKDWLCETGAGASLVARSAVARLVPAA